MSAPLHSPAPPLVGRAREQAALREALDAALAGRGSLVLIGGEAGIGKTTLAETLLAEAAAQGVLALVGRCYDLTETPPYGPWIDLFAHLPTDGVLPPLPAAFATPGTVGAVPSQAALFQQVLAFLRAASATRPLLLFLDDQHWADPASLDLLRFLAREVAPLPLLLLGTYRADELTRRHPLYALLPALVREARATRLALQPLAAADLRALVRARYPLPAADEDRLAAHLHDRTAGNPFYTGEILRTLEEAYTLRAEGTTWRLRDLASMGLPPLLRQVLDARLDRLGEAPRSLLASAAVIGQAVPLALWATVAGVDEDALLDLLERAAEAHLLVPTADGARFAHALVREALYEGTLPLRRRASHRRAAEALLAMPQPDPDAVAYHLQQADDDRAAEWLVRAGERAQRAYAWLTAAERYEVALALLERHGGAPARRGWLLFRLAWMYNYTDQRRGLAWLDAAVPLLDAAGDNALTAAVRYFRGHVRVLGSLGDLREAVAEAAAGVDALEALSPAERERLRVADTIGIHNRRGTLIGFLTSTGRHDEAFAMAEPYLAAALATPEAVPLRETAYGNAYDGLGVAHAVCGRPDEARRAFERARAVNRLAGHLINVSSSFANELALVLLPYLADHPVERRRCAADSEAAYAQARGVTGDLSARNLLLPLLLVEGRWAEARQAIPDESFPGFRSFAAGWIAVLAHEQGDQALARQLVAEQLPDGAGTPPGASKLHPTLALQRVAAALALGDGDLPAAQSWLEAHDRWLAWCGAVLWRAEGHLGWSAYHRASGVLASARDHAERALAHATEPRQPLALLAARRLLGELDTQAGRHAEATAHLDAALALAESCAAPYERALTLLALAELRHSTGAIDGARAALTLARELLEPLAAQTALGRADALAVRLARNSPSARPTPPESAYPAGLSAREASVLRLIAAGLTNAQAAERLFVSSRTVDQHLRSIYTKLGVNSRAAASAWAAQHGLAGEAE